MLTSRKIMAARVILLVVLCLFPLSARSAEAPLVLTFSSGNGEIALEGLTNGKPCRLIVDTGAVTTTLLPAAAKRLGVDTENHKGMIQKLELQTLRLKDLPCDVTPWRELSNGNKLSSKKADGVLGMDVLAEYALGIDFTQKTLVLWKNGRLSEVQIKQFGEILNRAANNATQNKDQWAEPTFGTMIRRGDWFCLHVFVNQVRLEMVIDLGAENTIVRSRSAQRLQLIGQSELWKAKGDAAEHEVKTGLVRQLKFGETLVEYPLLLLTDYFTREREAPDILGRNVFVNRRVILDFPGMMLYVSEKQGNALDKMTLLRRLGIWHRVTQQGVAVEALIDSPAYRAGLRGTSLLKSLNTTPIRPSVPLESQISAVNFVGETVQFEVFDLKTYQWRDLSVPVESAYSAAMPSMEQLIAVPTDKNEKETQIYTLSRGGVWLPLRANATELKAYEGKLGDHWTLPDGSKLYPFKSDGHKTPKVEAEKYQFISYDMKRTKLLKMPAGTQIVAPQDAMLIVMTPLKK